MIAKFSQSQRNFRNHSKNFGIASACYCIPCILLSSCPLHISSFLIIENTMNCDAPIRGSVDYPSTRGIQVDVGLPDATSENRAESPLYGELYLNTKPAFTCPKQSNICNISNHMSNTATWAHNYTQYTYQL